jgi:sulfide dehydrogenase cytochrome subunit
MLTMKGDGIKIMRALRPGRAKKPERIGREGGVSGQRFMFGAAVLVAMLGTAPLAAADPVRIALVTGGCTGCHGNAGEGGHGVPAIAGTKSQAEFVATMQAFREGQWTAPPTVMDRIARGYSDEDFVLMATRFARPN